GRNDIAVVRRERVDTAALDAIRGIIGSGKGMRWWQKAGRTGKMRRGAAELTATLNGGSGKLLKHFTTTNGSSTARCHPGENIQNGGSVFSNFFNVRLASDSRTMPKGTEI